MADNGYDTQTTPATTQAPGRGPAPLSGVGTGAGFGTRLPTGMGNQAAADALALQGPGSEVQAPPAQGDVQAPPAAPGASVASQLPPELSLESAGVSFRLPGNTALTGGWNQLQTTESTGVWINVSRGGLHVQFSPALEVDAQWPLSNVAWRGFTYDFASGRVSDVSVANTQIGIPVAGAVTSAVTDFVMKLVTGTPLGRAGYNPLADRDLAGTLRSVQNSFQAQTASGGGGGGDLNPRQIDGFALNASLKTRSRIEAGAAGGGIVLPPGAGIDLSVAIAGNAETLSRGGIPNVQAVYLSSSDLTLQHDGKPIARLRSLRIDRGGIVDVTDFEPLGKLAEVGAGESLLRLFGVVLAMRGGDPRLAGGGDISARVVNGVAEHEMETALTQAIQSLVREHHDAVPGVDLRTVLGVDPQAPSTKGPRS
jgi:hypothetical protein